MDVLTKGEPLVGTWYSRSQEHAARQFRRADDVDPEDYATEYELVLSPLPCWEHDESSKVRRRISRIIDEIEKEGAAERRRTKKKVLGVKKILRMDPHHRPMDVKKSPKPRFHAKAREAFKRLYEAYREVLAAHREASERLCP